MGLYKTELIKPRGPWRSLADVELATAGYVDWFNTRRLHSAIGDIPPAEHEAAYYAQTEPHPGTGTTTEASTKPGAVQSCSSLPHASPRAGSRCACECRTTRTFPPPGRSPQRGSVPSYAPSERAADQRTLAADSAQISQRRAARMRCTAGQLTERRTDCAADWAHIRSTRPASMVDLRPGPGRCAEPAGPRFPSVQAKTGPITGSTFRGANRGDGPTEELGGGKHDNPSEQTVAAWPVLRNIHPPNPCRAGCSPGRASTLASCQPHAAATRGQGRRRTRAAACASPADGP